VLLTAKDGSTAPLPDIKLHIAEGLVGGSILLGMDVVPRLKAAMLEPLLTAPAGAATSPAHVRAAVTVVDNTADGSHPLEDPGGVDVGPNDPAVIRAALLERLQHAHKQGVSVEGINRLSHLLLDKDCPTCCWTRSSSQPHLCQPHLRRHQAGSHPGRPALTPVPPRHRLQGSQ
jgi:hypothetical protein